MGHRAGFIEAPMLLLLNAVTWAKARSAAHTKCHSSVTSTICCKGTSARVGLLRQRFGAYVQCLGVLNRIEGFLDKTAHVRQVHHK